MVGARGSSALLLFFALSAPVRAQVAVDRPHRLVIDPSIVAASETRPSPALKSASESPPPSTFDVRPLIDAVRGALTATPHRRAADAAIGTALIAFGTRRHHPVSSAVFVGVHAVQLAAGGRVPAALRGFDIEPDVGNGRIAITVRRTVGNPR